MSAKPFGGYPSRTAYCLARKQAGLTPREIADEAGMNHNTVAALLHYARRRGAKIPVALPKYSRLRARLEEHAAARGLTAEQLAQRLLERVIDDNLVDAVLDDGDEA